RPSDHRIAHEGIARPLVAEGRHLPVPGHEGHVIAERPELAGDRANQGGVIAAREVGAADRALEQHVADDREPRLAMEEHHMPGRVAGAVQHLETLGAELDGVAILEPTIRFEGLQPCEAETLALLRQLIDPERIFALRAFERHAEALRELGRLSAVIDVTVREEDLLEARTGLRERGLDALEIAARIEDGGAIRLLADEQRTVLHERRDGNDQELHRDGLASLASVGEFYAAHAPNPDNLRKLLMHQAIPRQARILLDPVCNENQIPFDMADRAGARADRAPLARTRNRHQPRPGDPAASRLRARLADARA